jgi:hypothetical protein
MTDLENINTSKAILPVLNDIPDFEKDVYFEKVQLAVKCIMEIFKDSPVSLLEFIKMMLEKVNITANIYNKSNIDITNIPKYFEYIILCGIHILESLGLNISNIQTKLRNATNSLIKSYEEEKKEDKETTCSITLDAIYHIINLFTGKEFNFIPSECYIINNQISNCHEKFKKYITYLIRILIPFALFLNIDMILLFKESFKTEIPKWLPSLIPYIYWLTKRAASFINNFSNIKENLHNTIHTTINDEINKKDTDLIELWNISQKYNVLVDVLNLVFKDLSFINGINEESDEIIDNFIKFIEQITSSCSLFLFTRIICVHVFDILIQKKIWCRELIKQSSRNCKFIINFCDTLFIKELNQRLKNIPPPLPNVYPTPGNTPLFTGARSSSIGSVLTSSNGSNSTSSDRSNSISSNGSDPTFNGFFPESSNGSNLTSNGSNSTSFIGGNSRNYNNNDKGKIQRKSRPTRKHKKKAV